MHITQTPTLGAAPHPAHLSKLNRTTTLVYTAYIWAQAATVASLVLELWIKLYTYQRRDNRLGSRSAGMGQRRDGVRLTILGG